jgi:glycosyltransferase involved in cell wall biosynthesis
MRVLFIANSRGYGGAEKYVLDLAAGFRNLGEEVFFSGDPRKPLTREFAAAGFRVIPFRIGRDVWKRSRILMLNPLTYLSTKRFLNEIVRKENIDVVHVQFLREKFIVSLFAQRIGVPVVWTEHGPLPDWCFNGFIRGMYRSANRRAARVLCVCDAAKKSCMDIGMRPEILSVVHNGVRDEFLSAPDPNEIRKLKTGLGINSNEVVVGFFGRMMDAKGAFLLLEASLKLRDMIPDKPVKYLLIGNGKDSPKYKAWVNRNNISEKFVFIDFQTGIKPYYHACDIVTLPSYHEGLPFSLLEAMACGKPLVATGVGGIPEIVKDGGNGFIIPAGSADKLAGALCKLISDPGLRLKMGISGMEMVKRDFTFSRSMELTRGIFRECAGQNSMES